MPWSRDVQAGNPPVSRGPARASSRTGLRVDTMLPDRSLTPDERRPPTVLILLPGQPTGTQGGIDGFASGTRSALLDALPAGSSVYVEYTDLARPKTTADQRKLRDWYKAKYAGQPLDLIICGGQEPRAFLMRFRPVLWPKTPVIFAGRDERSLESVVLPAGTTALTNRYDEEGTIRAALALLDSRELRRWNLDERRLPLGSSVLYRRPSPWKLYGWPMVTSASMLLARAVRSGALLVHRTQRRRVQCELDERLRFETFLAEFSRSFVDVSVDQMDCAIRRGLGRIGEFLALDRVSLFELPGQRDRAQTIYSWSAEGVPPVPAEMPAEAFPWMSGRIVRGEVVTFSRLDALPPEARMDRASFGAYGARAHASIPLVEGATRRVLALTSVRGDKAWPETLVDRLRLILEILGQILARKHAEAELEESQALQRAMLSTLPSQMAVLDRDGRILAVNRAWLSQAEENDAGPMARAHVGASYLDLCREAIPTAEAGAREVTAAVEAVLSGTSETSEIEYARKRPASERWFHLSVMALRGSRGGAVVARTDVTEQVLAREQLRQFSGHLLAAQEEERRRIARELHDDLNQRLVLLAIEISQMDPVPCDGRSAESVRQMAERVGEIAADVHRLAYRLHPFKLEYLGLVAAARGLCSEIGTAHDIAVEFSERDVPSMLPSEVAVCAYRVLQEALSNVVKHSGATRAKVELVGEGTSIRLTVRDFGMGMAPDVAASTQGLGLSSIRERLRAVNGVLAIDSAVAAGAELTVRIPLSRATSAP